MSSKGGGGQSNKGKNVAVSSNFDVDQLNQAIQDVNLDSGQDGGWEVISKKNKNKAGNAVSSKKTASQTPNLNPRGQSNAQRNTPNNASLAQPGGRGGYNNYNAISNAISPPLQSGWNWKSRQTGNDLGRRANVSIPQHVEEDHNDIEELDGDDDELFSDEYDSDEGRKSHEERKKNRWYADFFASLDKVTVEQINEAKREWHCPACQNGPGAIDWYCSLQALVAHAKTKGSKRVKIHRDFAEILEEELRIKGATVNPSGESFGQWKGLNEVVKDMEIVWPPMVVIMNTHLEQDENEKWVGMGNPELLDYFGSYDAKKACHSYGPKGHRGMSVLIFESSAVGYIEAERLSRNFEQEGTDRDAWNCRPGLFHPGGKRKLYGYMATKKDMDVFNQHAHQGKSKLKFDLVSYQEKVVEQLKQMNEDNQKLHYVETIVAITQMQNQALEESLDLVTQKLRKKDVEERIVRKRTQEYHEEIKEGMDYLENQLKVIQDARNAKEGHFEKQQQEELERVEQSHSAVDPHKRVVEKLEEMKDFEEEREKLKAMYLKKKVDLEEWYDAELTRLMNKHGLKN